MTNKFLRMCGIIPAAMSLQVVFGADVAPATRPSPRVEIFAFTSIVKGIDGDWVGKGIQQNLQSDVSHTGATLILQPQPMAGDDAIATAQKNHADLAVIGTYQVIGDQLRVNGNVVDVSTNASIGGFSATGLRSDLFKVEDALGEQLRNLLPQPLPPDQLAEAALQAPAVPSMVYQPPVQNNYYSSPPVVNYDQSPSTLYVTPDYGSFYPYGYSGFGGFGFYSGGYYHRFHGYDHHGYVGHPYSAPGSGFHSGGGFHGGGEFHGGSGGGFLHGGGGRGVHGGGGGHR